MAGYFYLSPTPDQSFAQRAKLWSGVGLSRWFCCRDDLMVRLLVYSVPLSFASLFPRPLLLLYKFKGKRNLPLLRTDKKEKSSRGPLLQRVKNGFNCPELE